MSSSAPWSGCKSLFRWRGGLRRSKHLRISRDLRLGLDRLEDRITPSTFTVTSTDYDPTESGTLAYEINAAQTDYTNSGDTNSEQIGFSLPDNSTISLNGSDQSAIPTYGPTAYVIDFPLTIDGSGAPGLTIDGGNTIDPGNAVRLFAVTVTESLTLENLTLSGGLATGAPGGGSEHGGAGGGGAGLGGAIYDDGGTFTAEGVTFTNNSAQGGAGGDATSGSSTFGGQGGVFSPPGSGAPGGITIDGSGASRRAPAGSAAAAAGAVPALRTGRGVTGGSGGFGGGGGGGGGGPSGGRVGFGGFGGRTGGKGGSFGGGGGGGGGLGGGIFSNGGSITLVNDTFFGNLAKGGAGGTGATNGQAGDGYGGAVFTVNGSLSATFVTFSANIAEDGSGSPLDGTDVYVLSVGYGTGINGTASTAQTTSAFAALTDDILGQATSSTSDFVANDFNQAAFPTLSGQDDLISNNNPSKPPPYLDSAGFAGPNVSGIITGDNVDLMLGPLASNGGPTQTMALEAESPAIGAGVTAYYDPPTDSLPITTDQRGLDRADTPDIGAYEYTLVTPTVTGLNPTDGPPAGGTEVTITGTGFTGATAVEFGSTPATGFIVNSDTSITGDSPAGSGAVDVTVITGGGTSATAPADQFTYVARARRHQPEPDRRPAGRRDGGHHHRIVPHRRHGGRLRDDPGDRLHGGQRHHDHRR